MRVEALGRADVDAVNDVLCESFARYPVMRYVLGDAGDDALRRLVQLFTASRWLRDHPILGTRDDDGRLVGAITMSPPGEWATPPELEALADVTWRALGTDARRRYDAMRAAWNAADVPGERWHVNMLGVLGSHRGRGYGERLLHSARELAGAVGVDLSTEDERNLDFYRRRGFAIAGHARVDDTLQTWTLVADAWSVPALGYRRLGISDGTIERRRRRSEG